jgi:hypothetical protein
LKAQARRLRQWGKLRLLDTLEDKDKQSLYHIIDTFIAKKKLKDNLSTVLQEA